MVNEQIVLVDENDNEIGTGEKLQVHLEGKLHRALSVFLFNEKNELLIQQRAFSKYHSGGLWSNTCCSHPRPDESAHDAATRRLFEELGIRSPLHKIFHFTYKANLDKQLIEHEFDHVFLGKYQGEVSPNPDEIHAWKWIDLRALKRDMKDRPEMYTFWFKTILTRVESHLT
jgi:isopentenyl-diphosphate delta-isomerase